MFISASTLHSTFQYSTSLGQSSDYRRLREALLFSDTANRVDSCRVYRLIIETFSLSRPCIPLPLQRLDLCALNRLISSYRALGIGVRCCVLVLPCRVRDALVLMLSCPPRRQPSGFLHTSTTQWFDPALINTSICTSRASRTHVMRLAVLLVRVERLDLRGRYFFVTTGYSSVGSVSAVKYLQMICSFTKESVEMLMNLRRHLEGQVPQFQLVCIGTLNGYLISDKIACAVWQRSTFKLPNFIPSNPASASIHIIGSCS